MLKTSKNTGHFRIHPIYKSTIDGPKIYGYIIQQRWLWFFWITITSGFYSPVFNTEIPLIFECEKEALEFINKQPYKTKVLWTDV